MDQKMSYLDKVHYIDGGIERDIQFFKNNYTEKKKEMYALKKTVRERIQAIERKASQMHSMGGQKTNKDTFLSDSTESMSKRNRRGRSLVDMKIRSSSDDYAPTLKYTITSNVKLSSERVGGKSMVVTQRSPYIRSFVRPPSNKRGSF